MRKKFNDDQDPVSGLLSETVLCPLHGQAVEIQMQDDKKVGICRCDVPDNKWAGKTVIELALETHAPARSAGDKE